MGAYCCSSPRARARGSSAATTSGGPGGWTGLTFLGHVASTTSCSTARPGARCWRRPRPATWGRRSFRSRPRPAPGRSRPAARVAKADGDRPRRRSHVLAHAGPRLGAGLLVRRDLAPGCSVRSEDGGVTWEAAGLGERRPPVPGLDGHGAGRHPDGPKLHSILVDPRDPAHLYFRHVERRVHESRTADGPGRPSEGARGGRGVRRRRPAHHDPLRSALPEATPTACTSRTTAGIYRIDTAVGSSGPASEEPCRSGLATSASRWWCTRATRTTAWSLPMTARQSAPHEPGGSPLGLRTRNRRPDVERLASASPHARPVWR